MRINSDGNELEMNEIAHIEVEVVEFEDRANGNEVAGVDAVLEERARERDAIQRDRAQYNAQQTRPVRPVLRARARARDRCWD